VIQSDDTGLLVLDKQKKGGSRRGRLWANVGDARFVAYHYSPDWRHEHPVRFLTGGVSPDRRATCGRCRVDSGIGGQSTVGTRRSSSRRSTVSSDVLSSRSFSRTARLVAIGSPEAGAPLRDPRDWRRRRYEAPLEPWQAVVLSEDALAVPDEDVTAFQQAGAGLIEAFCATRGGGCSSRQLRPGDAGETPCRAMSVIIVLTSANCNKTIVQEWQVCNSASHRG